MNEYLIRPDGCQVRIHKPSIILPSAGAKLRIGLVFIEDRDDLPWVYYGSDRKACEIEEREPSIEGAIEKQKI